MAKVAHSKLNQGIQASSKLRRSLKVLQASADEKGLTGSNMVNPEDKVKLALKEKQSKVVEKRIAKDKENVPAVRRSKRKTERPTYVEPPDAPEVAIPTKTKKGTKTRKTALKSKKGHSNVEKKDEETISPPNETKLSSTAVTADTEKEIVKDSHSINPDKVSNPTATVNEDSGYDPASGISYDQSPMNSTRLMHSPMVKSSALPYSEISPISGNTPPLSYWMDLAEQRRIALEKALHENELLHDELTVLEAENTQLKQLVREAENLAQVISGIID